MWVISVLTIVILYFVYTYLKGLKTCDCVNDTYATRLKNLEGILLGLNVIMFCFTLLASFHLFNALDKFKQHVLKIIVLGGITMLVYYSYFAYNGYQFWNTLKDKCECADSWQKYYIYLQSFFFFLTILWTTIFAGFLAFKKVPLGIVAETALNNYIVEGTQVYSPSKKSSRSSKRK